MSYIDGDRVKWKRVLITGLISSDESETEDDKAVLVVKELTWRSDKVSSFFMKLDSAHDARKSEQATRQTKPHLCKGVTSSRSALSHLPSWAICISN